MFPLKPSRGYGTCIQYQFTEQGTYLAKQQEIWLTKGFVSTSINNEQAHATDEVHIFFAKAPSSSHEDEVHICFAKAPSSSHADEVHTFFF